MDRPILKVTPLTGCLQKCFPDETRFAVCISFHSFEHFLDKNMPPYDILLYLANRYFDEEYRRGCSMYIREVQGQYRRHDPAGLTYDRTDDDEYSYYEDGRRLEMIDLHTFFHKLSPGVTHLVGERLRLADKWFI